MRWEEGLTMTEKLYKVLNEDGVPVYGTGRWRLPQGDEPGEWMPPIEGELVACENGYHLCRMMDLVRWLGPTIYEAECRGERIDCDDKVVVRQARLLRKLSWDERVARLFACDCAEYALDIFEQKYPNDDRPRRTIEVARRFAKGEASREELAAAWAAAGDAARDAARDAERQRQTDRLMEYLYGEAQP